MKLRQLFVLVLALVMCVSFSSFAFAEEDHSGAKYIKYDKTYTIAYDEECFTGKIVVPAKGKITFHYEYKNKDIQGGIYVVSSDYEDVDFIPFNPKYDSSKGKYCGNYTFTLPKGTFYLEQGFWELGAINYSVKYKPIFGTSSISKLTAKKKGFTVKYKKATNATGYQIRYSTSSKMSNAKSAKTTNLSKSFSKLKAKKKYYVQVRSYKTLKVNGKQKTYYSSWSEKKSVKTK